MCDKASASAIFVPRFGTNDAHGVAVELEFDFCLRQQPSSLPDVGRNGHLPLRCDAHC
jgi:hypothetical protein